MNSGTLVENEYSHVPFTFAPFYNGCFSRRLESFSREADSANTMQSKLSKGKCAERTKCHFRFSIRRSANGQVDFWIGARRLHCRHNRFFVKFICSLRVEGHRIYKFLNTKPTKKVSLVYKFSKVHLSGRSTVAGTECTVAL